MRKHAHFSALSRPNPEMEEMGESTSLRAEIQMLLDDPANFYNIVMSNSGKREGRRRRAANFDGRGSFSARLLVKRVVTFIIIEVNTAPCNGHKLFEVTYLVS